MKYIGQRKCPKNIKPEKDSYLGSGNRLINAINKYGRDYFTKEIIHICNSQQESDEFEINFIRENKVLENKDKWYNLDAGGQYNRSEEHSKLTSQSMKKLYNTIEANNAVIIGRNKSRLKKGLKPLPYSNYDEYLEFKTIKLENKILKNISYRNKKKIWKIKRLKRHSKTVVYKLTNRYKDRKILAAKKANSASLNTLSLEIRKESLRKAWDKRKQSTEDNWTQEAKKSFAYAKAIQHNNNMLKQLIELGVPTWDESIKGLLHAYRNGIRRGYKDESNKILQANKIVDTIRTYYNINLDVNIILSA